MGTAYCMECRKKIEIKNLKNINLKDRSSAAQGAYPVCGTKIFRIGRAETAIVKLGAYRR